MPFSGLVLHVAEGVGGLFERPLVRNGVPDARLGVLLQKPPVLAPNDPDNVPADDRPGSVGRNDVLVQVEFHVVPVYLVSRMPPGTGSKEHVVLAGIVDPSQNVPGGDLRFFHFLDGP